MRVSRILKPFSEPTVLASVAKINVQLTEIIFPGKDEFILEA